MTDYEQFARYYDADFGDFSDDLPLYHAMARRTGGPILELMCGSGRLLAPLAAAGYELTGVDHSPAMLALAADRLAAAGHSSQVRLLQADVAEVELPQRHFNLACIAVNSFMHLATVAAQLAALSNVRGALARKGLLIIDLFNPNPVDMAAEDNRLILEREYTLAGRQVQKFVAINADLAAQTNYVTCLYDESDAAGVITRRVLHYQLRWFYRYELEHLLARAGFKVTAIYGSYDLDPYETASPRLIAFASPAKT